MWLINKIKRVRLRHWFYLTTFRVTQHPLSSLNSIAKLITNLLKLFQWKNFKSYVFQHLPFLCMSCSKVYSSVYDSFTLSWSFFIETILAILFIYLYYFSSRTGRFILYCWKLFFYCFLWSEFYEISESIQTSIWELVVYFNLSVKIWSNNEKFELLVQLNFLKLKKIYVKIMNRH